MIKGLLGKLLQPKSQPDTEPEKQYISEDQVQAIVDQRIKEHTSILKPSSTDDEEYLLTPKQVDYALSIVDKVKDEFEIAIDPSKLTVKDLNRLIAYNRYKNKGTLVNLVKKGVLKRK
ncbi:ABC transporter ATP-binding protein [Metabacillus halosaccharovorans]|uniref:ABC transporter ATP-binding protein n=1 Tax=Metabacillus halosaccharovorans TaxID=930124 RepID=UPI00203F2D60|nr:ABC transporter ATP-binding protein [Metabacillus halosaccharovorans]MCM3439359.1 ABC transporter ATP-binding protein [Metabacillus halosaccharovorans]